MQFAFGILIVVIGLPLLVVPIIGVPLIIIGFIVILSGVGSSNARKTAEQTANALAQANERLRLERRDREDEDEDGAAAAAKRFSVLAEVDDDIAAAVARIRPLGPGALAELREKVLAVGDKAYLDRIVVAIEAKHRRDDEEA